MKLDIGFFPDHLLETLPQAGLGWLGIFIVVLIMIGVVYGVSIFSVLLARFFRKRKAKKEGK